MADRLTLKWGTLKGWDVESDAFRAALTKYFDLGIVSASAMMQRDTYEQKLALCEAIDECTGEIFNDWSGETMTKADAKDYVMNYGKPQ